MVSGNKMIKCEKYKETQGVEGLIKNFNKKRLSKNKI